MSRIVTKPWPPLVSENEQPVKEPEKPQKKWKDASEYFAWVRKNLERRRNAMQPSHSTPEELHVLAKKVFASPKRKEKE